MGQNTTHLRVRRKKNKVIAYVFIPEYSDTDGRATGMGKTGLAYNTSTLLVNRVRRGGLTACTTEDITTVGTYQAPTVDTAVRFKLCGNNRQPGIYEVHFHDNIFEDEGRVVFAFEDTAGTRTFCPAYLIFDIDRN